MSEGGGSPQLSLSGCSSLFSLSSGGGAGAGGSSSAAAARLQLPPRLSLGVGGEEEEEEEGEEEELELHLDLQVGVSDDADGRKNIRMMKNRESALRSRARKRAYVQELEKEVRRLVDENLKLKRQCRQLKTEMAALMQPAAAAAAAAAKCSLKRTSSTRF